MSDHEIIAEIATVTSWQADSVRYAVQPTASGQDARLSAGRSTVLTDATLPDHFDEQTIKMIFASMVNSEEALVAERRTASIELLRRRWGEAPTARVVDYHGGVGTSALSLSRVFPRTSYYEADEAANRFATLRFARHHAAITTITYLAPYAERFDAVLALNGLPQGAEGDAALREMAGLTRPGGMLLVGEPMSASLTLPDAALTELGFHAIPSHTADLRAWVKGPPVTVIVPIYNAADHLTRLLRSVQETTPGYPLRWMFVNDASPDERIMEILREFEEQFSGQCLIVNQAENLGFLQTCNAAMNAAGHDDVILLNSDTILYDGWARKLVEAAGADPKIATVTPLSNRATIYSSFEHLNASNHINALLAEAELPLIDIPVGVGFCLYVKRQTLDHIGLFDPIFGKGYGEETDLCLRAAEAGYRNVLTPQAFVYHAGSASMVEANVLNAGETTIEAHEQIVRTRYPEFVPSVQRFVDSGLMSDMIQQLGARYIAREARGRPSIALVTHVDVFESVVGGTQYHVRDMMRELEQDYVFYVISPSGTDPDSIRITGYVDGVAQAITPASRDYAALLAELNPSFVHIHHLMNLPQRFMEALIDWPGQKAFTIHDYYAVCEQHNLLNDRKAYCGVPEEAECNRCAKALFGTGYYAVRERRIQYQRLIDSVSVVIAPSQAALDIFRKGVAVPDERARIIPHPLVAYRPDWQAAHILALRPATPAGDSAGDSASDSTAAPAPRARSKRPIKLRAGFIGYNSPEKGTALLQGIVLACAHDPIQFIAIGNLGDGVSGRDNVLTTGRYAREDVVNLIAQYQLDVMIVASPWPETFCYTLSEAWKAGIPAITGPLGAPAERIGETGAGIALPDYRVGSFTQALRSLMNDPARLAELKAAAARVTQSEDYGQYRELFATYGATHPSVGSVFVVPLQPPVIHVISGGAPVPIIAKLVRVRKKLIPVGSVRERAYFLLHNIVTRSYAGG